MKILVVYYSRSERTKQVADRIRQIFQCDIERIEDVESREGPSKFLKSTFVSIGSVEASIKNEFANISNILFFIISL